MTDRKEKLVVDFDDQESDMSDVSRSALGSEVEKIEPKTDTAVIIREAEANLQAHVDELVPTLFSTKAFDALREKISDYVRSLITESHNIARRRGSDQISRQYVEQAAIHLVADSMQRWVKHIGTIGGVLSGASLSSFVNMVIAGSHSTEGVVVSAVLGIAGAFMVALDMGRK